MAWKAKVHWTEELFLRPQRLQQADRYLENALESWTPHVSPYPWGLAPPKIERELVRAAPGAGAGQLVWLTKPVRADEMREVCHEPTENAARYTVEAETVIDSASNQNFPTPPLRFDGLLTSSIRVDRNSPSWREYSEARAICSRLASDWPELQMELWAVREDRR